VSLYTKVPVDNAIDIIKKHHIHRDCWIGEDLPEVNVFQLQGEEDLLANSWCGYGLPFVTCCCKHLHGTL
jgi:hypothetical protein